MMFVKYRWLATLVLMVNTGLSQSVDETEFNRHYRKSVDKLGELFNYKSVRFNCDTSYGGNYAVDVFTMLRAYKAQQDSIGALFYSFDQDELRIWLFVKKQLHSARIKTSKKNLLELEERLRKALRVDVLTAARSAKKRGGQVGSTDSTSEVNLDSAISAATAILLPPIISTKLNGLAHLMIIPELNIGRFPFYILKPYKSGAYLVDSLSVSFAPHLCNLNGFTYKNSYRVGKENAYIPNAPLLVGNPSYSRATNYIFPSLPGAQKEVDYVSSLLNARPLIGSNATISKVKAFAPNADLLYFATHGVFDLEQMLGGSFLAFSPDSTSDSGLWTANEIQRARLRADIAILSACQTGIGKVLEGGFIGIERAFYIAGVSTVVSSLWSVEDESTQRLMKTFVGHLLQPDYFYPARHLRKAILDYKKVDPLPSHWASFSVYGYPF